MRSGEPNLAAHGSEPTAATPGSEPTAATPGSEPTVAAGPTLGRPAAHLRIRALHRPVMGPVRGESAKAG